MRKINLTKSIRSSCSNIFVLFLAATFFVVTPTTYAQAKDFYMVLVDKAKNELHLAKYDLPRWSILKTYHVTLGKIVGDKEVEKDLKTPEGVYYFKSFLRPPNLKKKFGALAMLTDYPNALDRKYGKTGFDIMLHATDDPSRLTKDYDSEGCVVINNDEIEEVFKYLTLKIAPMIIYKDMKPNYLEPESNQELVQAFQEWLKAWEAKDLERYIDAYADNFTYNGMNKKKYKEYKSSLNQRYAKIDINAEHVRYFQHEKYAVVQFTQNYESQLNNGSRGFKSSGTKYLYFIQNNGRYKILVEDYSNLHD